MIQEELKQRLIELIASKVCDAYSPTCDEWQPHDCGKCYVNDCHIADIADHLIANGVTFRERGEWVHIGGDEWRCPACGNVIFTEGSWEKPTQKHCDECGADMRGE